MPGDEGGSQAGPEPQGWRRSCPAGDSDSWLRRASVSLLSVQFSGLPWTAGAGRAVVRAAWESGDQPARLHGLLRGPVLSLQTPAAHSDQGFPVFPFLSQ